LPSEMLVPELNGRRLFVVLATLLLGGKIWAGTTGKLMGYVKSAQGESLPGAEVVLLGTEYGAVADKEGFYVIMHIPPGTYKVQARMIGYTAVVMEQVRIAMNQTTRVDFRLHTTILGLEEVHVVSSRPIIKRDVSGSELEVTSNEIDVLPVEELDKVINLQAGVEGLKVRGGSLNQTGLLIDGFPMNESRAYDPYTALNLLSVQEIQFQAGGFNAEYGDYRSGVVNVVTEPISKKKLSLALSFRYRPPSPKHFGISPYDPQSYFLRPYLDTAVCWTGTQNGAWDAYLQRQYPSFEGWNAISAATMSDDDPSNDLTPSGARRLFQWQHRRNGEINAPDYVFDFSIGGPLLYKNENWGFRLDVHQLREMFIFALSRPDYKDEVYSLKINGRLSTRDNFTFMGRYGITASVSPYDWKVTPTGHVLRSPYEVASLLNSSSGNSILFMPGYFSPTFIYHDMLGIKINHVISSKAGWELLLESFGERYNTYQLPIRDTTRYYEIFPGMLVDEAPYGYWGYSVSGIDGMNIGGWMNLGRDRSHNRSWIGRFHYSRQHNRHNQFKTGVQVTWTQYNVRSSTENPSMSTWNRRMDYDADPLRIGIYFQDKLEFEGFIANLGLRYDYYAPNVDWYQLEEYDDLFKVGWGDSLEMLAEKRPAKASFKLSPRLGISHPISEYSKLYFNYGHFLSESPSSYRFRLQRESNGLVTYMGNPELPPEQTVAYELGYVRAFENNFVLNLAVYYKDITDQPGWIYYQSMDNAVQYYKAAANNYADIRGIELTLRKTKGRLLSGFINYTYLVQSSGYFGLTKYYQDPKLQRDYERLAPEQHKPHPVPYARMNLNLHSPLKSGFLGNWSLALLGEYKTGSYDTYNPQAIPGVVDNVRWRDYWNFDLRLKKQLNMGKSAWTWFVDVTNVFNFKYLSRAGFADYQDYIDYIESLRFPWESGSQRGNDRLGDYRPENVPYDPIEDNPDNDPDIAARNAERIKNKSYIDMPNLKSMTFLNPRSIYIGFTIRI